MADLQSKGFIYKEDFIQKIKKFIDDMKTSGKPLSFEDFSKIDVLHPAGHTGLNIFLSEFAIPNGSLILDIGCGIGGVSRYLASRGFRVQGLDILPRFLDCAIEITKLVNFDSMIEYQLFDICNPLPPSKFNTAITIGVLAIVDFPGVYLNIYQSLTSGALFYNEDYYVIRPMTKEESSIIRNFHLSNTKSKEDTRELLEAAGFEIVYMRDFSKEWSEYVWNRAEKIWTSKNDGIDVNPIECDMYGVFAPKILCHLECYTVEDIHNKFPNTARALGTDFIYKDTKPLGVIRTVARKN